MKMYHVWSLGVNEGKVTRRCSGWEMSIHHGLDSISLLTAARICSDSNV